MLLRHTLPVTKKCLHKRISGLDRITKVIFRAQEVFISKQPNILYYSPVNMSIHSTTIQSIYD